MVHRTRMNIAITAEYDVLDSFPASYHPYGMAKCSGDMKHHVAVLRKKNKGGFCINPAKKKQVRFSLSDTKIYYQGNVLREDYTVGEIEECWYSQEEKDLMRGRRQKMIARLEAGKPCRLGQTYRGLEPLTAKGVKVTDDAIDKCIKAVMDEQDHQFATNVDNFHRIARLSRIETQDSIDRALKIAKQDAQDVQRMWNSTETTTRLSKVMRSLLLGSCHGNII